MNDHPNYSTPFARVEVENHIATVTLTREERHNALHPAAHHALCAIWDQLEQDADVRVAIVTGSGSKAFCAGYDLKDNLESGLMEISPKGFGGLTNRPGFRLPVIAAVNGVAFGGGFEMSLACDIIVASRSARFALPEPKLGWAALAGGAQRLPHAIGIKRAMDIILTGRTVAAEEAFSLGLVSEVVDDDALPATARRWAEQIAANAPLSVRCSMQAAYASIDNLGLVGSLEMKNFPLVEVMLASEDALEGKQAFAEKRPPIWQGK